MNELSLFTGVGGGVLGSKILGWRTIGYVEYEPYCQEIIKQRITDGILDRAPIFGDIRKFIAEGFAESYQGMVDVVTGGFPCQDISIANQQGTNGIEGERSGLWKSMSEVIRLVRPKFCLVENSPMLTSRGLGTILRDLDGLGYDAKWGMFRASQFGFKHVRERIWILAYTPSVRRDCLDKEQEVRRSIINKQNPQEPAFRPDHIPFYLDGVINSPRNGVLRNDHGLDEGMVRIKAIGNGQVPICMAYAFSKLSEGIIE